MTPGGNEDSILSPGTKEEPEAPDALHLQVFVEVVH